MADQYFLTLHLSFGKVIKGSRIPASAHQNGQPGELGNLRVFHRFIDWILICFFYILSVSEFTKKFFTAPGIDRKGDQRFLQNFFSRKFSPAKKISGFFLIHFLFKKTLNENICVRICIRNFPVNKWYHEILIIIIIIHGKGDCSIQWRGL